MPYTLADSAMTESPDGKGVLLFGGKNGDNGENEERRILEFRAGSDSWNILDITLQNERKYHTVIPLF